MRLLEKLEPVLTQDLEKLKHYLIIQTFIINLFKVVLKF